MAEQAIFSDQIGTAYVFNRDQYIRIKGIQIGQATSVVESGPTPIRDGWPGSIASAGFKSIDAILHVGGGVGYFFSGANYIRIDNLQYDTSSEILAVGPRPIPDWPSLAKAGFSSIDAALYVGNGTAYFFYGRRVARVKGIEVGKSSDWLDSVDDIAATWTSLNQANFYEVTALLSIGDGEAFFFYGTKYIRVGVLWGMVTRILWFMDRRLSWTGGRLFEGFGRTELVFSCM